MLAHSQYDDFHVRGTASNRHIVPLSAIVILILMLSMGGCVLRLSVDTETTAIDVPSDWYVRDQATRPSTPTDLANWWMRFDDALLVDLIAQALKANTSVSSAQAALRQARALRDVSAAALFPAIGSSATAQRNTSGSDNASNHFQAGLDASWELDVFGVNRSALRDTEATVRARVATLGDVQVSIAAEVALDYIALRSAQVRLAIATDNLATQQETLQITTWRLQAGLVTALETEQARGTVEQTRAQLPVLRTSIDQSLHALTALTGIPLSELIPSLSKRLPVPRPADDLVLSLPVETLRQRADVRSAEYQVNAALARLAQADAARFPNFKLSGSLGLSAITLGALTNGASVVSSILAGVSFPIFDGGAASARVRAQQGALEQVQATYRASVLTALREVEDALAALRGDREREARLRQAADAAGIAAQLARQRFSSGLVDFQVVLETQRTALSTQDGVASAGADVSADHVRLYKALGGGWRPDDINEANNWTPQP